MGRGDPFQFTTDPLVKPEPFTIIVKPAAPALADEGASERTDGIAAAPEMVKVKEVEVPPPGAGLTTPTCALPCDATSAALIDACNCELLSNTVVRAEPFQVTTEEPTNPLPLTIRVKAPEPAVAVEGVICVTMGTGFEPPVMTKEALGEVPPPGAGLNTVTCAVPAEVISDAEMLTCSCVALTNVVNRDEPLKRAEELLTNPLPFTVRVNAADPAIAPEGEREVIEGDGLLAALIVKLLPPEVPPPGAGLNTVTVPVPAVARSAAVTVACSCVVLTNVVVRADPFQFTTEPLTKPLPLTVTEVGPAPADADDGESDVIVGVGLPPCPIVKPDAPDVPPPGAGLVTVTCAVPDVLISLALIAARS